VDKNLLTYISLGVSGLTLLMQVTGHQPKADSGNQDLYRLADRAIESARGTSICISWDCKGSADQPVQPVIYQRAEPGTAYVDANNRPLPLVPGPDGTNYIVLSGNHR
jgi:hypothetical protein